ncbi:MAG: hypothetical protein WC381_09210 [Kiritimatiellia bacterium]
MAGNRSAPNSNKTTAKTSRISPAPMKLLKNGQWLMADGQWRTRSNYSLMRLPTDQHLMTLRQSTAEIHALTIYHQP